MKRIVPAIVALFVGLAVGAVTAIGSDSPPAQKSAKPAERVGTYDSRAVAVAYCGSPLHEARIKRLDDALKQAKKEGDPDEIKKADRAVWEGRLLLHRQGFGAWPVDDILEQYPKAVAAVEKQANVTQLVSKWDKKALAKYKDAEKVDVTMKLVDAMKPNERQRRFATQMDKAKPIDAKKLEEVLKHEAGEHYLPPPTPKKETP